MLKLLKRIAPVGIAIVLVFLITITVTLIQDANDRTPEVSNSDKVYVSYKDLTVTNEKIYNLMKNQYGLAELLNMVDEKLFEKEVNALDVNDPEYLEFINEQSSIFKSGNLSIGIFSLFKTTFSLPMTSSINLLNSIPMISNISIGYS